MDSIALADAQSGTADVYMYRFDYAPPLLRLLGFGSMHGIEVPLALGTINKKTSLSPMWKGVSGRRKEYFLHCFRDFWIRFVKTGDPNGAKTIWEKYDSLKRKTTVISNRCRIEENPAGKEYEIWRNISLYH